jgi:hypothetical protein
MSKMSLRLSAKRAVFVNDMNGYEQWHGIHCISILRISAYNGLSWGYKHS